jgi:type IX secretion system PorP/SprF family membrane protein
MKKRISFVVLFAVMVSWKAFAQQDPQLTNWMFDRVSFNPAFAGFERMHNVSLFYRNQWSGFSNSPVTSLFNYHGYAPVGDHMIGFGISTISESLGLETNTMFRGNLAYHHTIGANRISAGLQFGMLNKKLGTNWVYIDQNDPILTGDNGTNGLLNGQSSTAFDMAMGLSFYRPDKYYVGVSMTHLTASDLTDLNYQMARHMYIVGGYNHPLNADMDLRTNLMMKTDLKATPATELNANILWKKMLWGGLTYRVGDAIAPMMGFQKIFAEKVSGRTTFNQTFRIGYSYDLTTSDVRKYSTGSHEVFVTYMFNISKEPLKTYNVNPRFLY